MSAAFELPLRACADLTGQALLLVDPHSGVVLVTSARARELLSLGPQDAPVTIADLFQTEDGLERRLHLALCSSAPMTFGATGHASGGPLTLRAQRYDFGQAAPLVLLALDAEPELSRRFRSLTERLLALNAEVERRRTAEQTLSYNMVALRRSLDVVQILSEIGTSGGGEHLVLATEAIASAFGAAGAVLIKRTASLFQCVAATGTLAGAFDRDRPLDIDAAAVLAHWTHSPALRDSLVLAALGRASRHGFDPTRDWVLPFTALGEPSGAIVCLGITAGSTAPITSFETGIIAEALGNLLVRADLAARLAHGQKLEAIGQLTGGIAHDFNNILAVVLGNAELLLDEVLLADRELPLAIQEAAKRGAILTSRLLSFARKQSLHPVSTDINRLLRDLDPMIRRSIGAHIDMQVVTAAGLWRTVIDRGQLEAALLNLAVNARDAMPDGGRLTLETGNARLDQDYAALHEEVTAGSYVMIAVSDTGTGMTAVIAAQAFMPFFTTKDVGKGSGLGLSMVLGFVKQSGGHVKIYTEPGRGTTVRLYFPREPDQDSTAPPEPTDAKEAALTGRGRILLVEDDPAVLRYTERTLALLGYSVDSVLNGADAIALLCGQTFDLLLTDVVLPGQINGRQVADQARMIAPEIAILFMSGYSESAIFHHGRLDAGAELLTKPFTRNQLAQKIKSLIGA